MKKIHILILTILLFLLMGVLVLFAVYVKEELIVMIPEALLWQEKSYPNEPMESVLSETDPQIDLPRDPSELPDDDPPIDPPIDPPVDPPIDLPIDPPVDPPIVSPTDPKAVEYWLYYTSDASLTADRDSFNRKIENGGKVTPIAKIKRKYTASEIQRLIEMYRVPLIGYREDGARYAESFYQHVLALRDLAGVEAVVAQTALTITKADVRAFPTSEPCYSDNLMQDLFQEAVLPVGTPILLLHESADAKFYFAISYFYSGWIAADQVMLANEEQFMLFADPEPFAVVTVPLTENGLNMGTILPLVSQNEETITVLLPDREEGTVTAEISLSDVSVGYLDATVHNLLKLSFSYLDTPYSWGDRGDGVDCSGLYVNVMRCMGVFLPRNTGDMRTITEADYISLQNGIPSSLNPCLIFRKGHVMLYLGNYNGYPYILHSPGSGKCVTAEALLRTDNLLVALCL